jgi:hypothetical protein
MVELSLDQLARRLGNAVARLSKPLQISGFAGPAYDGRDGMVEIPTDPFVGITRVGSRAV